MNPTHIFAILQEKFNLVGIHFKDKFPQKFEFSHYLRTLLFMELHSKTVAAFALTTTVNGNLDGDIQVMQVLRWILKDVICTTLKVEIVTVASDLKALTHTCLTWVHNLNRALRGNYVFSNQLGFSGIPDLDNVRQAVWSHFVDTFYLKQAPATIVV